MTEEEIKLNDLDNLIYEIEVKSRARSLSDEYLREHNCSDREEIP